MENILCIIIFTCISDIVREICSTIRCVVKYKYKEKTTPASN